MYDDSLQLDLSALQIRIKPVRGLQGFLKQLELGLK